MSDREFLSYTLNVREESIDIGIPIITDEDALVLYTLVYTYVSQRRPSEVFVVDAGAGIGYSALWLAKGLEDSCPSGATCKFAAIELVPMLAERLKEVMEGPGFEKITVYAFAGDALTYLSTREPGSLDIVFVDIDKKQYPAVLDVLREKLKPMGMAVFHNAYYPAPPRSFYEKAYSKPWKTTIIPTTMGLLVAIREG